jgi:hypothetical protein
VADVTPLRLVAKIIMAKLTFIFMKYKEVKNFIFSLHLST